MAFSVDVIDVGGLDEQKQSDVFYKGVQWNRPFVLRGLPWAATNKWNFEYLRENHGETVTSQVHFYDRESAESFLVQMALSRQTMSVANFFAKFNDNPQAWSIKTCDQFFKDYPDLLNDVKFEQIYAAAGNASGFQGDVYMFIAGPGSITGLHADLVEWNVAFQAVGQKHWKFYSPEDEAFLYRQTLLPVEGSLYSHIDPFITDSATIKARYPEFLQATEYALISQPGDLVYVPHRWWHAVYSISSTVSVNHVVEGSDQVYYDEISWASTRLEVARILTSRLAQKAHAFILLFGFVYFLRCLRKKNVCKKKEC